jgi:hypothetical protein
MATKKNGPLGTLVGKTGGYVTYYRMGQLVTRSIGVVTHWSDAQKSVQMGTSLITYLLESLQDFTKIGFKNTPKPRTWSAYNMATSVNKLGALGGEYPNRYINIQDVVLAKGSIPAPVGATVRMVENSIAFNWEPDLAIDGADKSDQVMCLAYFPDINRSIMELNGSKRGVGEHILVLPSFSETMVIETFMCFVSADKEESSDSVYGGQLVWDN